MKTTKQYIGTINLTVQSGGNGKLRLGIGGTDSMNIFKCRHIPVKIYIGGLVINCFTACGTPCTSDVNWRKDKKYKKGYDLNKKELSDWLNKQTFIRNENERSKFIEFNVFKNADNFILESVKFH